MSNLSDKDKRVEFLEEAVRRLLKERTELEIRARMLEDKLHAQMPTVSADALNREDEFLKRFGELVRPLIHEIKGQLDSLEYTIQKVSHFLEKPAQNNGTKVEDFLRLNSAIIERLRRRITDLSYLGGKLPDIFCELNVHELIRDNLHFIESLHPDSSIELSLFGEPIKVLGDKWLFNEIITNLVINAIEASVPSKRQISLKTRKSEEDSKVVEIIIEDNGIGIYPSEMDKIYDLYYTTKKTGFGIGLYLVKQAVKLHNGEIFCRSSPGQGTIFTVKLPTVSEAKDDTTEDASCR